MKWITVCGGSLCFLGLVLGAMTGAIIAMLIPAAAGLSCFGAASCYQLWAAKREEAWRANYPPYRY